MDEKFFNQMLNLGSDWEIVNLEINEEKGFLEVKIKDKKSLLNNLTCPHCKHTEHRLKDHAPERDWLHLKIWTYETKLFCRLPRAQCKSCSKVWTVPAPWEGKSKGLTQDVENLSLTLMRYMPVNKVGDLLKIDDQKLWRMLDKYVADSRSKLDWSDVTRIGVDELSAKKGHDYLSVFVDMQNKAVLFATDGKGSDTFDDFTTELYLHNGHPHAIEEVSMDMSPAYQKGCEDHMRNASKVFDHFHVIQNLNKAIGAVYRKEKSQSPQLQSIAIKTRILQRNEEDLKENDKAAIKELKKHNLCTGLAHRMKVSFQNIYKNKSALNAQISLRLWISWVKEEADKKEQKALLISMRKFAESVQEHLDGILAHWKHGTSNGLLEGLNSVFSAVKRRARGFRNKHYMKTMLYFIEGKLSGIPCLIH